MKSSIVLLKGIFKHFLYLGLHYVYNWFVFCRPIYVLILDILKQYIIAYYY